MFPQSFLPYQLKARPYPLVWVSIQKFFRYWLLNGVPLTLRRSQLKSQAVCESPTPNNGGIKEKLYKHSQSRMWDECKRVTVVGSQANIGRSVIRSRKTSP